MTKTSPILALFALLASSFVAPAPAAQTDIHKVDFNHFAYPVNCEGQPTTQPDRTIHVINGKFQQGNAENGDLVLFTIVKVEYGDLLANGSDQAAVLASCYTGSNFDIAQIFIYEMAPGGPKLIARLFPSEWGKGQEDNGGSFAVSKMAVTKNDLAVTFFAGGSHACPDWDVTAHYKWNGKQMARVAVDRRHHQCQ